MNQRIQAKYLNLDGKLLKVVGNDLYFNDQKINGGGGGSASFVSPPTSSTSNGTAGAIAYDSNYFYICIATNRWVRTSLAQW